MYSYIRGELAEIHGDYVVLDVGGIGYQIYLSDLAISELPMPGADIKVHTYLYLREDIMMLFGFLDRDDLEMFKLLLTVSGIGPKGAMAILSIMSSDDLRFAILSEDAKAIAKANGVGGKTASRVVLDLKDKIHLEDAFEKKSVHVSENANRFSDVRDEAIEALVALGYSVSESTKAVAKVERAADMTVEEVLKAALGSMALF